MNNKIKVRNEYGQEQELEVINIFQVEGYEGKDYILYTNNRELDEDHVEAFVSILLENEKEFSLLNIEDDQEWEDVQKAIQEMSEMNE